MKSYLVKWLIAIVLAVLFLWLSLETDFLPKEVYPILLEDGSVAAEAAGCEALVAPAYSAMAECAGTVVSTLPPLTVTVLEQSMVAYTLQYSPSARDRLVFFALIGTACHKCKT